MNGVSVEDLKFTPGSKLGLAVGLVQSTGTIQIKPINDPKSNYAEQNLLGIH